MDIVQFWSGGKDSTCAGRLHLERGDNVHFVCYVPYFDNDIPLIPKDHFSFLNKEASFYESMGAKVDFVHGLTYWDFCTKILVRGERKGSMQSYPCFMKNKCGFNRDSKSRACSDFASTLFFDFKDVGLCADEYDRKVLKGDEISILQEKGFTQTDTMNYCVSNYCLSPVYFNKKRDGCTLCPNGSNLERIRWFEDYKEFNAKDRLLELQYILRNDAICKGTKLFYPLRGKHYFIENSDFISPYGTPCYLFGDLIF